MNASATTTIEISEYQANLLLLLIGIGADRIEEVMPKSMIGAGYREELAALSRTLDDVALRMSTDAALRALTAEECA